MQVLTSFSLFLLLFDGILAGSLTTTDHGPSLEFLFNDTTIKEIHLEVTQPKYSVLVPLSQGRSTVSVKSLQLSGKFHVIAPKDYGVMVVVQALRLRTKISNTSDSGANAQTLKCRDYLRFQAKNDFRQVCGFVSRYNKDGQPYGLLGPRAFLTKETQMEVTMFTDRVVDDPDREELNTVELVFTAYKECPDTFMSQWAKWTGGSKLKACAPVDKSVCISAQAFCDTTLNCGIRGPLGTIGFDEENCRNAPTAPPTLTPNININLPPIPSTTTTTTTTPIPTTKSTTSRSPVRGSSTSKQHTTPAVSRVLPTVVSTPRAYIGVSTPYNPPTSSYKLNPLEIIGIFVGVVLIIFGTCTWLARANEKKFQHTVYRFSTMRRNRRTNRQRAADAQSEETLSRLPTAPPPSESVPDPETNPSAPTEVVVAVTEQPPPYHALFPAPNSNLQDNPTVELTNRNGSARNSGLLDQ